MSIKTDEGTPTAMVIWESPTVFDNTGNVSDVQCYPQSGTKFAIGQTIVMCEAVDGSGNVGVCSIQINVTGKYLIYLQHFQGTSK